MSVKRFFQIEAGWCVAARSTWINRTSAIILPTSKSPEYFAILISERIERAPTGIG
jgi:hypothetical protein